MTALYDPETDPLLMHIDAVQARLLRRFDIAIVMVAICCVLVGAAAFKTFVCMGHQ